MKFIGQINTDGNFCDFNRATGGEGLRAMSVGRPKPARGHTPDVRVVAKAARLL